jgi:hypothetical protein
MPDLASCALDSAAGTSEPAARALDMLELLAYPWSLEAWAPRDGDYFVANCAWGGRPPEGPASGSWTMDDSVRAGVFIDGPDAHAFLAFAFLGTGRIGYDYGSIRSAGDACHWYFYDPEELGKVAKGERKPWDLVPRSRFKVEYPRGVRDGSPWGPGPGDVTGACFDAETRLLYIYQRFSIDTGTRELFPCVHAYRLK